MDLGPNLTQKASSRAPYNFPFFVWAIVLSLRLLNNLITFISFTFDDNDHGCVVSKDHTCAFMMQLVLFANFPDWWELWSYSKVFYSFYYLKMVEAFSVSLMFRRCLKPLLLVKFQSPFLILSFLVFFSLETWWKEK